MQPEIKMPPIQPVPSTVNVDKQQMPDGSFAILFTMADPTGGKTHFWPVDFAKKVVELIDAKIAEAGSGLVVPTPNIDLSKILNGHGGGSG